MLVELLIVACLVKEPARCEEFHVPFVDEMNVVQCMWQSTIHAAEWAADHPEWQIKKIRCDHPRA
jgi:hypothetical protein